MPYVFEKGAEVKSRAGKGHDNLTNLRAVITVMRTRAIHYFIAEEMMLLRCCRVSYS